MKKLILSILQGNAYHDELSWLGKIILSFIIKKIQGSKNKHKLVKKLKKKFKITDLEALNIIEKFNA